MDRIGRLLEPSNQRAIYWNVQAKKTDFLSEDMWTQIDETMKESEALEYDIVRVFRCMLSSSHGERLRLRLRLIFKKLSRYCYVSAALQLWQGNFGYTTVFESIFCNFTVTI